jgi:hypothetical protein
MWWLLTFTDWNENENFAPHVSPVTSRKILVCHVRLGFPGLLFPRVLLLTSVFLYIIHVLFRSSISIATWTSGNKSYFVTFMYWWCIVFFRHILVYCITLFVFNLSIFHITFLRGLLCLTSWLLRWRSNWRAIISCCSLQCVHWLIAKIWICVTDVPTRSALNSDSYITRR